MTMKVSDLLAVDTQRATTADALNGLERIVEVTNQDHAFALALMEACQQGGIDFACAYAHGANESDWFRDPDFTRDNNAFGIGHPDSAEGGIRFGNVREGARFYVGELLLKLRKPVPPALADARSYAPVKWDGVEAVVGGAAGPFPIVRTIDDLNKRFGPNNREAVWMTDPLGPAAIVTKGNRLFPTLADQGEPTVPDDITFGQVPHPEYTNRIIPSDINTAWNNLGPRTIKAVVWHRMLGSLWGTDAYFRGEGASRALTDYGVGVAAQDGSDKAGDILMWNDPRGNRSPWANGRVSAPYGDGLAFVNRFGVDAVNRDATAIEISGFQTTALDDQARDAIAGITAYWADQAQIPWNEFPKVEREARSFVIWHQEFTIGTGKECPFTTVMNETNALIERTRGVMKRYQTGATTTPPPPEYADPNPPAWLAEDLERGFPIDHVTDGLTYYAALRPYVATRAANRLQGPDIKAPKVGPRLAVRETFRAHYVVKTAEGRTFVLTPYGSYVDIKALTPRVTVRAA